MYPVRLDVKINIIDLIASVHFMDESQFELSKKWIEAQWQTMSFEVKLLGIMVELLDSRR